MTDWIDANDKSRWPCIEGVKASEPIVGIFPYIPVVVTDGKEVESGRFEIEYDYDEDGIHEKVVLLSNHILDGEITHFLPIPPIKEREQCQNHTQSE